jgi:hypothetical protein
LDDIPEKNLSSHFLLQKKYKKQFDAEYPQEEVEALL